MKPAVNAGEPEDTSNYEEYKQEGFKIYIQKDFPQKDYTISYRKGLFGDLFGGLLLEAS